MIKYNPKAWFSLIFQFHKSDTFRILLPSIISVGIYTLIISYLELEVFPVGSKNLSALHSLLGFVLSLLLVFRTNTAYDRWWEGRRQWGELVNNTRNLAMKIRVFISSDNKESYELFNLLINNFVYTLKEHLRNNASTEALEENHIFSARLLEGKNHLPNALALIIYDEVNKLYKNKTLTGDQLILCTAELKSLTDICGACERIRSTPIPYSYSLFIKKFIFVYIITLPFGMVSMFGYATAFVVMFVFYVLTSIELLAEEIEDPFGRDSNDLPTDEISLRIKMNLKEILEVRN